MFPGFCWNNNPCFKQNIAFIDNTCYSILLLFFCSICCSQMIFNAEAVNDLKAFHTQVDPEGDWNMSIDTLLQV